MEAEFGEEYPFELIEAVADEMEVDRGPWGVEDYGDDGGDRESDSKEDAVQ